MGGKGGKGGDMKPGDWICPNCGDHVFARNAACRQCGTAKPANAGLDAGSRSWSPPSLKAGAGKGRGMVSSFHGQAMGMMAAMMGQAGGGMGGMMSSGNLSGKPRTGDWFCPACNDLQFAKNTECRQCGMARPADAAGGGAGGQAMMPGDWICPNCGDLVFARNAACRQCGTEKPDGEASTVHQGKPGDWTCPACNDFQFARNSHCRKCGHPKPDDAVLLNNASDANPNGQFDLASELGTFGKGKGKAGMGQGAKPGDWTCPQCQDLVFARNASCRMCGYTKPAGAGNRFAPY